MAKNRFFITVSDFILVSTIFLLVLSYTFGLVKASTGDLATITDVGNGYLTKWYPLICTWDGLIVSIFFVIWAKRVKACLSTTLATYLYCTLHVLSFVGLLTKLPRSYHDFLAATQGLICAGIGLILLSYLLRLCLQKFGITSSR